MAGIESFQQSGLITSLRRRFSLMPRSMPRSLQAFASEPLTLKVVEWDRRFSSERCFCVFKKLSCVDTGSLPESGCSW